MSDLPDPPAGEEREPRPPFHRNPFVWYFLIGIATITLIRPCLRYDPAPPPVIGQVPPFELLDTGGNRFGDADLEGRVWIADFIFTRCGSICPLLTRAMAGLQQRLEEADVDVRLVSFTVDPEYDTPEVLAAYAETHGADPDRWHFLTGEADELRELIEGGFKLAVGSPEQVSPDLMDIAHSGKFVLVDGKSGIRGYYDTDAEGLDEIFHRSQHVLSEKR